MPPTEPQPGGTLAVASPLPDLTDSLAPLRRGRYSLQLLATFAAVLILGNLGLLAATLAARAVVGHPPAAAIEGVDSLRAVDGKVLRGANPTLEGYVGLRDAGVTTVVDLRAEHDAGAHDEYVRSLGMEIVHLPIRDGQTPTPEQQAAFLDVVRRAPGTVFLHCGAGVGRTGAVAARYLVDTRQRNPISALARNLEVGPPSIEQNAYSLGLDRGPARPLVVAASRYLDGPRRLWHNLGL